MIILFGFPEIVTNLGFRLLPLRDAADAVHDRPPLRGGGQNTKLVNISWETPNKIVKILDKTLTPNNKKCGFVDGK